MVSDRNGGANQWPVSHCGYQRSNLQPPLLPGDSNAVIFCMASGSQPGLPYKPPQKDHSVLAIGLLLAIFASPPLSGGERLETKSDRSMPAANDLRKGMAILYNGDIAVVLDTQHRTPGNLRAFVQATIRSIKSGKSSDVRFSSTERVEVVPMTTRKMDFSYKDGEDFVFSDPETFETVTLSPELVGAARNYLVENAHVTVTFVEEKAVSIDLPASVVLRVTDAPDGIRGDSANNV